MWGQKSLSAPKLYSCLSVCSFFPPSRLIKSTSWWVSAFRSWVYQPALSIRLINCPQTEILSNPTDNKQQLFAFYLKSALIITIMLMMSVKIPSHPGHGYPEWGLGCRSTTKSSWFTPSLDNANDVYEDDERRMKTAGNVTIVIKILMRKTRVVTVMVIGTITAMFFYLMLIMIMEMMMMMMM